jgi:hypothetical protein
MGEQLGMIQESMYDKDRKQIIDLLSLGLSVRKVVKNHLSSGYPPGLSSYITSTKLIIETLAEFAKL